MLQQIKIPNHILEDINEQSKTMRIVRQIRW